ncbi:unnamed protein product, partial [Polarella glacialis]
MADRRRQAEEIGEPNVDTRAKRQRASKGEEELSSDVRRLLVFTDVGEEVDDEGALWMMSQVLDSSPAGWVADVVFSTGKGLQRAMRWAKLLLAVQVQFGAVPGRDHIKYFLGPDTDRHMRYPQKVDTDFQAAVGIVPLTSFQGGDYDVVLQLSPLGGFACPSKGFARPSKGPDEVLSKVRRRPGASHAMYILVGKEGSTNFPLDEAQNRGFKQHLVAQGFQAAIVEASNYAVWEPGCLDVLPRSVADLVEEDEWNKAVGRIPPTAASLFVRFRVNAMVNYNLVRHAFEECCSAYGSEEAWLQAKTWWGLVAEEAGRDVYTYYVSPSRRHDDASSSGYGNPLLAE